MTAADRDPNLPIEIHDAETIIRATKARFHLNPAQNKLRHQAFRPPPGETAVSVMRQLVGDDFCKNKGVEICGTDYAGLSAITAAEVRRLGSIVYDDRQGFRGHAHVDHQLPPIPRDQPAPPDVLERYDDRCKKLTAAAVFHKDPSPDVPGWGGPPLRLASLLERSSAESSRSDPLAPTRG